MLESIASPADLRQIPEADLPLLAAEIRQTIIKRVAVNGGHLASNCGAVELTLALHRVFDTPEDRIFFDVGHQAYTHKLLTGRQAGFEKLRKSDGISGFPFPSESIYDPVPAGHAGSALPAALGAAAAAPAESSRLIVVIGDGCVGCGMNFEAMNNISSCPGKERLILIINDNQMSISRNVGAMSGYLNHVISGSVYNRIRRRFKRGLKRMPGLFNFVRGMVNGVKNALLPKGNFFEALGIRYLGPVDGHDLGKLLRVLEKVKTLDGPLVLHVATEKGYGCTFASKDPTRYHGISGCDPESGRMEAGTPGFSRALGEAMLKLGAENENIFAVSAAMMEGTGLKLFAEKFPERSCDAGIAEEYAVTFACGLAAFGKRPVCAIYDTFLQRALDSVYHDGVLAGVPLIIVADRAGAVEDGPTHHGIYNCGFLRTLPQLTICSPARCSEVEPMLRMALELASPVVIRYPRGGSKVPETLPKQPVICGKAAVIAAPEDADLALWSIGAELATALKTAELLKAANLKCAVIDARFLKPFDQETARRFAGIPQFTIEDHSLSGGLFSALLESSNAFFHREIRGFGWSDDRIIAHGSLSELRSKYGLTPEHIAGVISGMLAGSSAHRQ